MPVLRRHLLLVLPLLLAAIWLRGLTPAGWMPGADGITMTMCGTGALVHAPDGKAAPADQPGADQPCAFAGMAALDGPPVPQLPLPLVVLVAIVATATRIAVRLPRPHRVLPPSQGPPALQIA